MHSGITGRLDMFLSLFLDPVQEISGFIGSTGLRVTTGSEYSFIGGCIDWRIKIYETVDISWKSPRAKKPEHSSSSPT